ncbi:Protocadherin-8 [Camelus dromedarius]|uniref:Protocadherin-8 n=1 Tax=Camelus dromedarius TaxID=9838 RepID=A0A5N4D9A3_CAMDR|nr:Protocadherin-8 [Camelus dromedarius]
MQGSPMLTERSSVEEREWLSFLQGGARTVLLDKVQQLADPSGSGRPAADGRRRGSVLTALCGQAPQCVLAFNVVSFPQEQFGPVHLEVEVRAINDHAPRAQIPVEVSEDAAVGTRIPLEVPVDEDVGANGLQSVHLAEPHSPFRVELQTRADRAQCADLVLLQELDRESQAAYSLELVAQDGGRPPRSATAALSVRVLDANDHTDPDEGPNGDVVFAFGARTPPEARRLFRLDPRSGRLTLAGPVDYERQDT